MSRSFSLLADRDIQGPVAAWVLTAHAYALLVPLVLVAVVLWHRAYIESVTAYPTLFLIAAALLCAGSAFEIAQNAIDRWYITPDTGSAGQPAVCDFLFSFCITAGQALVALAIAGDSPWVLAVALLAVAAQPACYARQVAVFAPLAATGLLATLLAYEAFGDPIVFLQLVLVGVTLYFFTALLRTAAQVLHGCTTAAAASGIWFLAAAISGAARGERTGGGLLIAVVVVSGTLAALAWRPLLALPPTERRRAGD